MTKKWSLLAVPLAFAAILVASRASAQSASSSSASFDQSSMPPSAAPSATVRPAWVPRIVDTDLRDPDGRRVISEIAGTNTQPEYIFWQSNGQMIEADLRRENATHVSPSCSMTFIGPASRRAWWGFRMSDMQHPLQPREVSRNWVETYVLPPALRGHCALPRRVTLPALISSTAPNGHTRTTDDYVSLAQLAELSNGQTAITHADGTPVTNRGPLPYMVPTTGPDGRRHYGRRLGFSPNLNHSSETLTFDNVRDHLPAGHTWSGEISIQDRTMIFFTREGGPTISQRVDRTIVHARELIATNALTRETFQREVVDAYDDLRTRPRAVIETSRRDAYTRLVTDIALACFPASPPAHAPPPPPGGTTHAGTGTGDAGVAQTPASSGTPAPTNGNRGHAQTTTSTWTTVVHAARYVFGYDWRTLIFALAILATRDRFKALVIVAWNFVLAAFLEKAFPKWFPRGKHRLLTPGEVRGILKDYAALKEQWDLGFGAFTAANLLTVLDRAEAVGNVNVWLATKDAECETKLQAKDAAHAKALAYLKAVHAADEKRAAEAHHAQVQKYINAVSDAARDGNERVAIQTSLANQAEQDRQTAFAEKETAVAERDSWKRLCEEARQEAARTQVCNTAAREQLKALVDQILTLKSAPGSAIVFSRQDDADESDESDGSYGRGRRGNGMRARRDTAEFGDRGTTVADLCTDLHVRCVKVAASLKGTSIEVIETLGQFASAEPQEAK